MLGREELKLLGHSGGEPSKASEGAPRTDATLPDYPTLPALADPSGNAGGLVSVLPTHSGGLEV